MKAWLRLAAQTAVRQRMRRREFRFRLRPAAGGGVAAAVRARRGGFAARFELRGGSSDARTFAQIFLDEQYNLRRLDRWPEIERRYRAPEPGAPLVLDLGANIGLSALFFTHLFPGARVLAVEPDPGNAARLRAHAAGQAGVLPLEAAVAGRDGRVRIANPEGPTAGRRTSPAGAGEPGTIEALSIGSLLARARAAGPCRPWLVKIDIEGAEQGLFAENLDWLDQFPLVLIEPHDWTLPGSSRNFRRALLERDRDLLVVGESLLALAPPG